MKQIIEDAFKSLVSLSEEDFRKILAEHELSDVGLALKEIWEFGINLQPSSQIGANFHFSKAHEDLIEILDTLTHNNVDLYEALITYKAANDHHYALAA